MNRAPRLTKSLLFWRSLRAIARQSFRMLLVGFALVLATAGCGNRESPVRVVLITLDTLRFDYLDSGPSGQPAMPRTSEHAERGVRFQRFYSSSSVTQPVHASLLTGLYPWEHGVTRNGVVLSERIPNIVETFKARGFETAAVVASFPLASRFGFARGFDRFVEDFDLDFVEGLRTWEGRWRVPSSGFHTAGNSISERALDALDAAKGKKQFFWFHFFDPHSPYGSTDGGTWNRQFIFKATFDAGPPGAAPVQVFLEQAKRLYARDVAYLDAALARVLDRLAADADRMETHVFVVSDHGESFGEGGSIGHGYRLSEEQLRVPAFLLSPRVASRVEHELAGSIDVAPTLLALAGVPPEGNGMAGRDLSQPGAGNARAFAMRRTFETGTGRELRMDRRYHELKGLLFAEVDGEGQIHLGNGRGLANTSTPRTPATERAIVGRFREFEERLRAFDRPPSLDPEVRRGLEALGYVD